jgi:hypothetical protein
MICAGANDPNIDSVSFIPAGKTIDNINSVSGVQIIDGTFAVDFPYLHREKMRQQAKSKERLGAREQDREVDARAKCR